MRPQHAIEQTKPHLGRFHTTLALQLTVLDDDQYQLQFVPNITQYAMTNLHSKFVEQSAKELLVFRYFLNAQLHDHPR